MTADKEKPDCACRLCRSDLLSPALDLGEMPIGHHLRKDAGGVDAFYPLAFDYCAGCGLLQISSPIPAGILYEAAETYMTSFQNPPHLADVRATILALTGADRAVEIACNDGLFLQMLHDGGIGEVAGIEPNPVAAGRARKRGIAVETGYLTQKVARRLVSTDGAFPIAVARHVVEHVDDLGSFFAALRELLTDDGLFYMELPWVEPGFDSGNPSVLWEEHLSYFTEPLIRALLAMNGFEIIQRRVYAFGGGAIGFLSRPSEPKTPEWNQGPYDRDFFSHFAGRIEEYARTLRKVINAYRAAGWRVALYGAAPRSSTVINFARAAGLIDMIIDDREDIRGLYMAGTKTPITTLDSLDDRNTLLLMGVGSENEHKVRRKVASRFGGRARFISLFTPRDAVASMSAALGLIR